VTALGVVLPAADGDAVFAGEEGGATGSETESSVDLGQRELFVELCEQVLWQDFVRVSPGGLLPGWVRWGWLVRPRVLRKSYDICLELI
jgi:hypothetical protein